MRFTHMPGSRVRAGQRTISDRFLNSLAEATPSVLNNGPGIKISEYGSRVSIQADEQPEPEATVITYASIIDEFDDYLLCARFAFEGGVPQKYDSKLGAGKVLDDEGELVDNPTKKDPTLFYVAKPWDLQKTPWDGKTVDIYGEDGKYTYNSIGKRSLAINNETFQQEITHPYFQGAIIMAQNAPTGYAIDDTIEEEEIDEETGEITTTETEFKRFIVWTDLNVGGRNWGGPGTSSDLIVRKSDGSQSVSGVNILELDPPELWNVVSAGNGKARINTVGQTGTWTFVRGCTGGTLQFISLQFKNGILINVVLSP